MEVFSRINAFTLFFQWVESSVRWANRKRFADFTNGITITFADTNPLVSNKCWNSIISTRGKVVTLLGFSVPVVAWVAHTCP